MDRGNSIAPAQAYPAASPAVFRPAARTIMQHGRDPL